MSSTTFSSGTVITSDWLNDVNDVVYKTTDVTDPISHDATGDGVTDDSVYLQAAIDSGKKIVEGLGLTYKINSRINLRSNLTLRNMTLDFSSLTDLDGSYRTCLKAQGGGRVDSSVLASNATESTYSVTVTAGQGTKFAAGDFVMLTSEDAYNYPAATVKRGEIKQVQKVVGDTVTFREGIYETYTTANTATLHKLSLLENITLENVKIIGTNIEGHWNIGFRSQYVRNLKVRGCDFKDNDLYELAMFDTIEFDIDGNNFDGVRYTGTGTVFYGVVLSNCCQWGMVRGNYGQELRHLVVTVASSVYYGQPYFITVSDNVMQNAMAGDSFASWAYENHGFGRWITWANNHADSCYVGINLEKGDQIVIGNTFRNCRVGGIWFDTDARELNNIIIANNIISKATTDAASVVYGIQFTQHASQSRNNIIIANNVIEGFGVSGQSDFGIRIRSGNGAAVACTISDNIIRTDNWEANDYGIYIEQGGWTVTSNHIRNYERGIALVAVDGCNIVNNVISVGTITSTNSAVAITSPSNKNVVARNIFRGVYRDFNISSSTSVGNHVYDNTTIDVTNAGVDNGTGTVRSPTRLTGSATYDPPSLADGAGVTTTVTVTGAVLGDSARATFSLDLQGITLTAWVSAANTVSVRFQNESGAAVDLASGTLRAAVEKL